MLDIENLEVHAKAATPGPWYTRQITDDDLYARGLSIHADGAKDPISDEDHAPSSKDANYIAAANPAAVLELIATVRSQAMEVHAVRRAATVATTSPMCERKTDDIMQRDGYAKTGYVMMTDDPAARICVSDMGAVAWFTRDEWNWLMHNRDHVEFAWPKPVGVPAVPAAAVVTVDMSALDKTYYAGDLSPEIVVVILHDAKAHTAQVVATAVQQAYANGITAGRNLEVADRAAAPQQHAQAAPSFDTIEDAFPKGGKVHDDGQITVNAAWLHQFARNLAGIKEQAKAALIAIEDPIIVPRGLIGAACSSIDRKRDAPKVLAELRRYTMGDLSSRQQPASAPSAPAIGHRSDGSKSGDDYHIEQFAKAMSEKMLSSRAKGRSGWDDPEQCSIENLAAMLCQHVMKGDPVDIANFCMMLHQRDPEGEDAYAAITQASLELLAAVSAAQVAAEDAEPTALEQKLTERINWTVTQWAEHVGARENDRGEITFGTIMALRAMMIQFQSVTQFAFEKRIALYPSPAQPAPGADAAQGDSELVQALRRIALNVSGDTPAQVIAGEALDALKSSQGKTGGGAA
ncbi:hypothetical protein [Duganella violaceipulchra]|uniref:Uncharacterized protein n=1 Tax=Duganella violaceipulchra TaxID=2849652 RepID=A0AA41H7I2_9BURK|nr:hypothetical protein [Duganella violaceicalia]MBV6321974.1 hypothetical protein [Duganella violaceicalia]MCP2007029.1 hypothetical protein [Duganella violaceicalia]